MNARPATVEDQFWRRTRLAGDGHLDWTGYRNAKGTASFHWRHVGYSALRVAYQIRTGSEPVGYAHATCEHPSCVAPDHVADSATTPRRAHHAGTINRQPNGSDGQVEKLLHQGLSDKQIGKQLRTSPKRVGRIRAALGLPSGASKKLTFEDRWAANTEPIDGGHLRWTGRIRGTATPAVLHEGRDVSPRRIAFESLHGRPATGPVLPGCDYGQCVRPDHLEDQIMRAKLADQYAAIFGNQAA